MAISQSLRHMKSFFCLMHWVLLVYILTAKVDFRNSYIWLAAFAFPVVTCEPVLKIALMAVTSVFNLMFWILWFLVLAGIHDPGCSFIRFSLLALPFVKSRSAPKTAQAAVKYMSWFLVWILKRVRSFLTMLTYIPWTAVRFVFPTPSILLMVQMLHIFMQSALCIVPWILWMHILMMGFEVPFLLCEGIFQIAKTTAKLIWSLYSAVKLTSIENYLDNGHPVTMFHDTLQFHILSRDGQNLWKGFIDVVLDAYEDNRSWAGGFSGEHLRMRGSRCVIEMKANYPANYENLLLDLAKLAVLLIPHFETVNQLAPRYVQELYGSMTAPLLPQNPAPSPEQLQKFVRFMRNHPALRSARRTNSFVRQVFDACQGMGQAASAAVAAAVGKVRMLEPDWKVKVEAYGSVPINRTLYHGARQQNNFMPRYGVGAWQVFRFIRNFLTHGAARDAFGRPMVSDMEELDLIIAEIFADYITELVYHLVMDIEMTGLLHHAWQEYV